MPSRDDRAAGCLYGLAIGDALGAAVEFRSPGTFDPVTGYRSGGPHPIPPGGWTDDTSMALSLADSIASVGWNLDDQAARYAQWWRDGRYSLIGRCFDIGIQTQQALQTFLRTGVASTSGPAADSKSGNGSIMRLAPVPIATRHLFPDDSARIAELSAQSSLPTHGSRQCRSACRLMGVQLAGLMSGVAKSDVLSADWPPITALLADVDFSPEIAEVAAGSFRAKSPPEIIGSGWVVKSLEAALWAFAKSTTFEEAVLAAVNLGNDADTTGAVCGQYAGACHGLANIPPHLLDGLDGREQIDPILDRLLASPLQD